MGVALLNNILAVNSLDRIDASGVNFAPVADGLKIGEILSVAFSGINKKFAFKTNVVSLANRVKAFVEIVHHRYASGDLNLADAVDWDLIEVLHDAANHIVVRSDENSGATSN